MAAVSSVADLERINGLGVPAVIVIKGVESVRAAPSMLNLLQTILPPAEDAAEVGHHNWGVVGMDRLRCIPRLADKPADADLLRRLNDTGKEVRREGKKLRDFGLSLPGNAGSLACTIGNKIHKKDAGSLACTIGNKIYKKDAGSLACTLGNKIHKMVSLAFNERGSGNARSEFDRGRYVSPRRQNLLDQVVEVLDDPRVTF